MTRSFVAASLVILAPVFAHAAPEIRFCPEAQVRTYPLEDRRGVEGLLLQYVGIVNRDNARFEPRSLTIDLMRGNDAIDSRAFTRADMEKIGAGGAKAAGALRMVPFLFCGDDLIRDGEKLAGPDLARNEALLIAQQVFAFEGPRDRLRVRIVGVENGEAITATGEIPIRSDFAKTKFRFPLQGVWLSGNGPSFHTGHRWAKMEEFAFDIGKLGASGLSHSGDGTKFTDYYAYGADVLAAADGRVVSAHDGEPEDASAMQRPSETQTAYFVRLQQDQGTRLAKGVTGIAGNYVVIDHGSGEYSVYAHMQPGSLRVKAGDVVRVGQPLGKLGSSGNSTEPHLHFQVCDSPEPLSCAGIPVDFTNITIFWADLPRPVQSGDVVITQ